MKTINGEKVVCSMVAEFDFSREEADRFLATPVHERGPLMVELLSTKHPNREGFGTHAASQFLDAIGKAMVQWCENELKQLPEYTQGDEP